ncbi:hypothetical protein EV702DRAFT_1040626 [Suillus placidus]|uniref:DUF6532 domain-containing protein n=1 Tax=Suillus placidus TaxID=48579 RepID=A0A9P7D8L0_9AGAM|nr:hypothetical protein EV702DRAFT_1040626 [Suillus placidus]
MYDFVTFLTWYDQGSSQATQSGFGMCSPYNEDDFMAKLGQGRPLSQKVKHSSNKVGPMTPYPSTSWRSKKSTLLQKLIKEGLALTKTLKGTVKRIHSKSRTSVQLFMGGAYDLSLEIFSEAAQIVPSWKAKVLRLLQNYTFLDTYIQRLGLDGVLQWFRVPFANPAILNLAKDMLLHQQYSRYVYFNETGWELRLMNVIALAGTFCYWVLKPCSENGWFKEADFYTTDFQTYYDSLVLRMTSLVGVDKMMFDDLLLHIHRVFFKYKGPEPLKV